MGINYNMGFGQLLKGKTGYKDFESLSICMLGKLQVNFSRGKLKEILEASFFDYRKGVIDFSEEYKTIDSYNLFKVLGFKEVHALDISEYEGADILFDLSSDDVPDELRGKFDYIYDGGTIQHIFNLPRALINTCKLVKTGGVLVQDLSCVNRIDFGFWTLSPLTLIEFYKNNAFHIENIFMVGYEHSELHDLNIVSPDCRYNNNREWAETCGKEFTIVLVCVARKLNDLNNYNLSFPQGTFKNMWLEKKKSSIQRTREKVYRITQRVKKIWISS